MNPDLEFRLLNDYQHDFPLVAAPFAAMAAALGVSETDVLATLARLQERGVVSRVGAVVRPRSIGASTLAALAVPEGELERVAQMVSAYPEVNHNYQREHHYNLWFVVAAPDELALQRVLREIEERSGCRVLYLPCRWWRITTSIWASTSPASAASARSMSRPTPEALPGLTRRRRQSVT